MNKKFQLVLTQGLLAGSLASLFSTVVMAFAGRRDAGSATAPINAISHWAWGNKAFEWHGADLPHTGVGYLTHHGAATFWATSYAALASQTPALRTVPGLLLGAVATSAVAYVADFKLMPHRFTPGYAQRLSTEGLVAVYAALAVGLAAGALVLRDDHLDERNPDKSKKRQAPDFASAAPRIVRHVRAGRGHSAGLSGASPLTGTAQLPGTPLLHVAPCICSTAATIRAAPASASSPSFPVVFNQAAASQQRPPLQHPGLAHSL